MPSSSWIDDFIAYTDRTQPPKSFLLWTGISTVAAILGRKVWFEWQEMIFPNLYIILVGPPACGKSYAMSKGEYFLRKLPGYVTMAPDSTTFPELVAQMSEESGAVTAFSEEMLSLFRKGEDLSSVIGFYIHVFGCKPYDKRTRTQGRHRIDAPFFNWLAGIQPDVLNDKSHFPQLVIQQGLVHRMIFVVESGLRQKVLDPRLTEDERHLQAGLMRDLVKIGKMEGEFRVDSSWEELYKAWFKDYDFLAEDEKLRRYGARKMVFIQKLSLIFAAARREAVIRGSDFKRALATLDQNEPSMAGAFSKDSERFSWQGMNEEIESNIAEMGEATYSELYETVYSRCSEQRFVDFLISLEAANKVKLNGEERRIGGKRHIRLKRSSLIKYIGEHKNGKV